MVYLRLGFPDDPCGLHCQVAVMQECKIAIPWQVAKAEGQRSKCLQEIGLEFCGWAWEFLLEDWQMLEMAISSTFDESCQLNRICEVANLERGQSLQNREVRQPGVHLNGRHWRLITSFR